MNAPLVSVIMPMSNAAPFVEGAVAAGVTANLGAPLEQVFNEAISALKQKESVLGHHDGPAPMTEKKSEPAPASAAGKTASVTVPNPHGLHARPAAQLIKETRSFHSQITVRNLTNQRGPVSVQSLSSLATLEILQGTELEFTAVGDDAAAALEKITALVKAGLGDDLKAIPPTPKKKTAAPARSTETGHPVPICAGIAIGPIFYLDDTRHAIPTHQIEDVNAETDRLRQAVAATQTALESRRTQMTSSVGAGNAGIYEAQILALQDPELIDAATTLIRDEKVNAAQAWDHTNQQVIARYQSLQDDYLRERATDLEDVSHQVLAQLLGKKSDEISLPAPSILIAANLTPLQVSALPKKLVLGVILLDGGPTAHSSILLKAMGIPSIVRARGEFRDFDFTQPVTVAFDGTSGKIWLHPDPKSIADLTARQTAELQRIEEEKRYCQQPGATRDGERVEIFANIGSARNIDSALQSGAEGVGLLRTEFLFLERDSAPTEQEQIDALLAVAKPLGNRPLIVRTLDAGGDKELPYLQMPAEENPFLGIRAIRLCFAHDELFTTHLRAILRAGHGHDFRIMFPMIADVADLRRAKEKLAQVHRDLEKENIPHIWPIPTGIMIEIPSAALQAEALAQHADFFSIGTNDLTQYTLAADRGNPELAAYQDAAHPAVLRLIEKVVAGARAKNRLVAVCGEAASDNLTAALFVGLGVRELSMSSSRIPHLKARLRAYGMSDLKRLAQVALQCTTAAEVRAAL